MIMKKRTLSITLIITVLMLLFSAITVFADDDDHGADAHSGSMSGVEEEYSDDEPLSEVSDTVSTIMAFAPYVIGVIAGIIVLVIIVNIIKRGSERKQYKGKHGRH